MKKKRTIEILKRWKKSIKISKRRKKRSIEISKNEKKINWNFRMMKKS